MKKNVLMTAVILLGIMTGCTDSLEQQIAPAAKVETELTTRASSGRLSTYTPHRILMIMHQWQVGTSVAVGI